MLNFTGTVRETLSYFALFLDYPDLVPGSFTWNHKLLVAYLLVISRLLYREKILELK